MCHKVGVYVPCKDPNSSPVVWELWNKIGKLAPYARFMGAARDSMRYEVPMSKLAEFKRLTGGK